MPAHPRPARVASRVCFKTARVWRVGHGAGRLRDAEARDDGDVAPGRSHCAQSVASNYRAVMARQAKPKSEPFTATTLPPLMLDVAGQVAQARKISLSELLGIAESARSLTGKRKPQATAPLADADATVAADASLAPASGTDSVRAG